MKSFFQMVKHHYRRYKKAEIQSHSAELAYHTVLAVVPVIGLTFWYLKSIDISQRWFNLTKNFLLSRLNVGSDHLLVQYFDQLTLPINSRSWGLVGLFIIFYTAWNLIAKFSISMDTILDATMDPARIVKSGIIRLGARRLTAMLLLPVALTLALVATQWLRKCLWVIYLTNLDTVGPWITVAIAWGTDIVLIFLIYYLVPRIHVPWNQALKVASIVGPAAEITRLILGHYSRSMVLLHRIYGIFVVIPLFIFWVQVVWMIILSGTLFIRLPAKQINPD